MLSARQRVLLLLLLLPWLLLLPMLQFAELRRLRPQDALYPLLQDLPLLSSVTPLRKLVSQGLMVSDLPRRPPELCRASVGG